MIKLSPGAEKLKLEEEALVEEILKKQGRTNLESIDSYVFVSHEACNQLSNKDYGRYIIWGKEKLFRVGRLENGKNVYCITGDTSLMKKLYPIQTPQKNEGENK
jgi:hypothetical protein